MINRRFVCAAFLAAALLLAALSASGFTQSGVGLGIGSVVPMGHEWITWLAAFEVLEPGSVTVDPSDPRRSGWTKGLAKDLSLKGTDGEQKEIKSQTVNDSEYRSKYLAIYSAIVGERWVDIGGFVKGALSFVDCLDSVTQQPVDVQWDHFMRRWDERGGNGGVTAARASRDRFIQYFVAAVTAPRMRIAVYDGGGSSALRVVDHNYFLLGRAAHLLQDSFSPEHTVRIEADGYERVRQVKSYLCAPGSEQHSHGYGKVLLYAAGDVIWSSTRIKPGWATYKPSNMTVYALVATEATKDLWAAFLRAKSDPDPAKAAETEANKIADNWMSIDVEEMRKWYNDQSHRDETYVFDGDEKGTGQTLTRCMSGLGVGLKTQPQRASQLEMLRSKCLYNIGPADGYGDVVDNSLRIPYSWQWLHTFLEEPKPGWMRNREPVPATRVRVKSVANQQYLSAPDGLRNNSWVYARAGATPLDLVLVGSRSKGWLRLWDAPDLFVSYTGTRGQVKLFNEATDAAYQFAPAGKGLTIRNLHHNQYMWLSGETPYVSADKPDGVLAWWIFDGPP
ncbi:MAG: hypothetical protein QOE68_928 [Thermoanaerobaculia bacterium]|nr:hypothetical protein [Thermoanaerobaculia bacterium]